MRRRALLLVVLAGALAVGGGVALGTVATATHDAPSRGAVLARAHLADVMLPAGATRVRDSLARGHDVRRDVAGALVVAAALTLAGGWWFAREHAHRRFRPPARARQQPRAPPRLLVPVHC